MNESSLPPLRDLPLGRLDQRAEHLHSEITGRAESRLPLRRFARPRLRVARPVLLAVVAAFVALALVPIGGASLAQRAVDGVIILWSPTDQSALDAAAEDAKSIAGSDYFTGAYINSGANTVDVYLADAPPPVLDELEARHPGTYVIHNDAPNTSATLLRLEAAFDEAPLQAEGIQVTGWEPTVDGYLHVGVTADVATAQEILDKIYGPNVIRVYQSFILVTQSQPSAG